MCVNGNFVCSLICSLPLFKGSIKTFIALSTGTKGYNFTTSYKACTSS